MYDDDVMRNYNDKRERGILKKSFNDPDPMQMLHGELWCQGFGITMRILSSYLQMFYGNNTFLGFLEAGYKDLISKPSLSSLLSFRNSTFLKDFMFVSRHSSLTGSIPSL